MDTNTATVGPLGGRILVVGMGALGQVFAAHLARGGAEVSCLVRPAQADAARAGWRLAALRKYRAPRVISFRPTQVFTDVAEVGGGWDAIWLCTHSTAMRETWVGTLRASSPGASVVSIGAGIDDRAALETWWPADQVVEMFPSILAFPPQGPNRERTSIAFWVPPGARPVSGAEGRGRAVAASLARGGMAARYVGEVATAKLSSAFNMPMVIAEEAAGWSPAAGRSPLALAAAGEAMAITAAALGAPAPEPPTPFAGWRAAMLFALAAPFDTAVFRRRHFTKIGAQSLQMLDGWIFEGAARGLPTANLTALRQAVIARRASGAVPA